MFLSDVTHSNDDTSHFYQIILFLLLIPMLYLCAVLYLLQTASTYISLFG